MRTEQSDSQHGMIRTDDSRLILDKLSQFN